MSHDGTWCEAMSKTRLSISGGNKMNYLINQEFCPSKQYIVNYKICVLRSQLITRYSPCFSSYLSAGRVFASKKITKSETLAWNVINFPCCTANCTQDLISDVGRMLKNQWTNPKINTWTYTLVSSKPKWNFVMSCHTNFQEKLCLPAHNAV
jgi:hypothetical protein